MRKYLSILFFLITVSCYSQPTRNLASQSSYSATAASYRTRVLADGGTIIDYNYVVTVYNLINSLGINTQGIAWISPSAGVKKDGSNNVTKMYNLFGTIDAKGSPTPVFVANAFQWNQYPAITMLGKTLTFTNITLPTYIDIVWGHETFSTGNMYWLHGNGTNGIDHYYGSRWAVYRPGTGTPHYAVINPYTVGTGVNFKRIFSWRYNDIIGIGNVYVNKVLSSINGSINGTLRPNTDVTANFVIGVSGVGPESMVDFVVFKQLTNTKWQSVRDFLINKYSGKEFVCEGNSLMYGSYASATKDPPSQLYTLIKNNNPFGYGVTLWNQAVPGSLIEGSSNSMTSRAAYVDSLLRVNNEVLIGWEIVNTWGNAVNRDTVINQYKRYFLARLSKGWKPIAMTTIDQKYYIRSGWSTDTAYMNNRIRTEFPSLGIGVIDPNSDSRLQDANNTTYFQSDKIHLTDAGYAIVAQLIYNKITQ
jgi:hypothetical protein